MECAIKNVAMSSLLLHRRRAGDEVDNPANQLIIEIMVQTIFKIASLVAFERDLAMTVRVNHGSDIFLNFKEALGMRQ